MTEKTEKKMSAPRKRLQGCRAGCSEVCGECAKLGHRIMAVDCKQCCKECCSVDNVKKKLPILQWAPKYRLPQLQGDIIAGLTVGLTVIPQGLAYAMVAELPPQYGLYSAFMGCFVYCILGTSKDITLGPTAIMSLMVASFGASPVQGDATIAIILSLFCGIIQFLMGVLNIGFLVDFISFPVIEGFTTAAAITIAFGQVKKWLGLKNIPREFIHQLIETFAHIKHTNLWDFAMGLIVMILLFSIKKTRDIKWKGEPETIAAKIGRKLLWLLCTSRNAIIVLVTSAIAAIFVAYDIGNLTLTADVKPGLPDFKIPSFSVVDHGVNGTNTTTVLNTKEVFTTIGAGFIIVPVIGLVETIAIGKAFARKNKYKIDANQELIAIGLANVFGCFVSAYPVTGSFSRTAVNSQSGVKTPAGGIWTALLVILSLAFLTYLFKFIPQAALAGVIIMAVLDMVEFHILAVLWRVKKADLIPWFVTFIFSFLLGIEYGILLGVLVSLLMLLYPWARPAVSITREYTGAIIEEGDEIDSREVVVVTIDMGVLFPGIEFLKQKIIDEAGAGGAEAKHVVLDFQHISGIDYSVVHGLEQLIEEMKLNNLDIIFTHLPQHVFDILHSANIKGLQVQETVGDALRQLHEDSIVKPENGAARQTEEDEDEEITQSQSLLPKPEAVNQEEGAASANAEAGSENQNKEDKNINKEETDEAEVKVNGGQNNTANNDPSPV